MFVCAFVLCTKAGGVVSDVRIDTGTSFEKQKVGEFHPSYDDDGRYDGTNYWNNLAATNSAVVAKYSDASPAYVYPPYAKRNPFLTAEEPATNNYLAVDLDAPLERLIAPREGDGPISNVYVKTWTTSGELGYDGIYADTLIQLSPSLAEPTVDWNADRIIVWLKETELDDSRTETNLMITAGRYVGGYGNVTAVNYKVESPVPVVAAGEWHRLTIRAISDVTEYKLKSGKGIAQRAPGFTVYLDGLPVVVPVDAYDIGIGTVNAGVLSAEARVLISERRLFPWIANAATVKATTLSRFSFGGKGAVDDVSFSTSKPDFVSKDNVFTLKWDAGIVSTNMLCIISNATSVVTHEIDTTKNAARRCDFVLGAGGVALVTVTNVVYDYANDYSNGVWTAEGGCTVTNNSVFVCDGAGSNPIGYVLSSRRVISVGAGGEGGCSASFAEAKALAKANGIKKILLETDLAISNQTKACGLPYYDKGSFEVFAGDDLVLDLNGHTLRGTGANPTVVLSGGKLRITDSSKTTPAGMTGRILPSTRASQGGYPIAVWNYAPTSANKPELTIDAGWFDGLVAVTGAVATAVCYVEGGAFTNVYDDAVNFYLGQYVTNSAAYFGLDRDYWKLVSTNGVIWCGLGKDDRWDNKDNWKGGAVPGAGDLAIFPAKEGGWAVDFGTGVETKALLMDADIVMAGTNEFSDIAVVSGGGRLVGAGLATFTGKLPGMLTGETGEGEIRLGEGWSGTVRISAIGSSLGQELASIKGWGNSHSKVEFNGVRGYVFRNGTYTLPYGLILTDYVCDGGATTNAAWNNEMGYTGSTVSFPTLSGSGTFLSAKIRNASAQLFMFKDVEGFFGKFNFSDKRLLLGTGSVAAKAEPGDFTFSNDAHVRAGLGWSGVNAHFGTNLLVHGVFMQELMSYSGKKKPAVQAVVVTLVNPQTGETNNMCRLKAEGGKVTVVSGGSVDYDGQQVPIEDAAGVLKNGATICIPPGSAVSIDGNRVVVNGVEVSAIADYYIVQQVEETAFVVQFDEEKVTPTLAEFSVSEEDGTVTVKVENALDGLWYGLQTTSSLAAKWQGPTEWKQPGEDGTLTFNPDLTDASAFFRVLVTDRDPNGGGE